MIAAYLVLIPLIGLACWKIPNKIASRVCCWTLAIVSVLLVNFLSDREPAGTRMLVIIVALLWSMKAVVMSEASLSGVKLNVIQWLAFTVGWFGMRPNLFTSLNGKPTKRVGEFISKGLIRLAAGAICFLAAFACLNWIGDPIQPDVGSALFFPTRADSIRLLVATLLVLAAFSLLVHFGIFNLLTGFWRRLGAKCNPLFVAPLLSCSLAEFWGRRWNLAFSEMTALGIYRPVNQRFGKSTATLIAFVFSGLLHELAISVPAKAGYGLPLLYFALHGVAMLVENRFLQRQSWFISNKVLQRAWTIGWIALPLPILFHRPFLTGCVWPLLQW